MIAIISDIHGNNIALSAVLGELSRLGVEKIICLGDICGYYSQINECCEALRSRNIFSLMGNHDWYIVFDQDCPRSSSANRCLNYQRDVLSNENLEWLTTLEPQTQFGVLSMVHGGWNDPIDEYVTPSDEYFDQFPGQFFVSGHTHVPCIWSGLEKSYCNPGSVGQPRDGDPRASFALWNQENFSLHRVEYDFKSVQVAMHNAGFEPYFYRDLEFGARIGGEIDRLIIEQK